MPPDGSLERLRQLTRKDGVDKWIAILPEVHYKRKYAAPTGIVLVSKSKIFPPIIAMVVNCGMRVIKTPLRSSDLDDRAIDEIYRLLMKYININMPLQAQVSYAEVGEVFLKGGDWVTERYGAEDEELINIENRGNMFLNFPEVSRKEILKAIPPACFKMALHGLGYMGGGGHFIEMQSLRRLFSPEIAQKWGLFEGQLVFMIHSDSGPVGGTVSQYFGYNRIESSFLNNLKFNALKWKYHLSSPQDFLRLPEVLQKVFLRTEDFGITANSSLGRKYILSSYAVANFGYAKRMILTRLLRKAIREATSEKDLKIELLYDVSHNFIQKEEYEGEELWVHRHGCCRCLPSEKIPYHPIYRQTGQPFPLPSSMATPSYICAASAGSKESYYSSCHGTGKNNGAEKIEMDEKGISEIMQKRSIRLYRRQGKGNVARYAPQGFKTGESVIKELKEFDIAKPVAEVMPLAVLKE